MLNFTNYPPSPTDVELAPGTVLSDFRSARHISYPHMETLGSFMGSFLAANLSDPSGSAVVEAVEHATRKYPKGNTVTQSLSDAALRTANIQISVVAETKGRGRMLV